MPPQHAPLPRAPLSQAQATHFDQCRDAHSGAVFIVASGPSAKEFPIQQFAHVPMITMNGAISMFMEHNVRPLFYACTDLSFPTQQPELFAAALRLSNNLALRQGHISRAQAFNTSSPVYLLRKARPRPIAALWPGLDKDLAQHFAPLSRRRRALGFSRNLARGFFDARTVAYAALQLAYHLGFNKVYLVGFDMNEAAGRFYETQGCNKSPCGLDQHFQRRTLPALQLMANKVVNDRFEVVNLSTVSRVPSEVIPVRPWQSINLQSSR